MSIWSSLIWVQCETLLPHESLAFLEHLSLVNLDVESRHVNRWVTNKLLSLYNIFSCHIVIGDSCGSKVMTLNVFAKLCKKLYDPLDILVGWLIASTWRKHNILIFSFDLFLICFNSVIGILIKRHLAGSCLFCIKMHHSETLRIWLNSLKISKSWSDDILQSESSLMQQLDHSIRLWTVLFCNVKKSLHFIGIVSLMLSFSMPIKMMKMIRFMQFIHVKILMTYTLLFILNTFSFTFSFK